ncbi:MAG: hypothetical protein KKC80_07035, partial [Candidatus Margulisbacteria bacterium]|nr:hypothetical protein [Candidatus Margulisiibacteriota bacterium]MBU1617559.1 hypothetical protein [Candidatus Margulisiibacteriota bacterium]
KSWLEQAKEDFKIWFKKDGPGKAEDREPLVSEIPSKYIVIAHSMGGHQSVQLLFERVSAFLREKV